METLTGKSLALFLLADLTAVHLPLTLLLVFGTAKLFANICQRLGQPGLVGEIIAGVLLGPSVFYRIDSNDIVLNALAEMGVMFLLFRVGLDIKASELIRVGKTALIVAVLGVALPFLLGWVVMAFAGVSRIEAIFVGATMVATSVGITAQMLASRGLLQHRASQVILAAAVIDDILGLLVLALVSSMAEGHINFVSLMATGLIAFAFTTLIAKYGTRTFQSIVPRIEQSLAVEEGQFHLALVILFALAVTAVYIGVAAIVGAFLAGMALSETVDRRVRDLAHGITELLVPFFLAGIGLHLDLSSLAHRGTLALAALICGVAVLSKFIGCGVGMWRFGLGDAMRVGIGMVPRGEVGMVVAQIGLSMGVIEKPVYGIVVLMAIVTTLLAPPALNYAYRNCRPGTLKDEFTIA